MRLSSKKSHALGEQNTEMDMMKKAMSGNMALAISPATVAPVPTSEAWTRTVTVSLNDSSGNRHTWFNAAIASKASIGDTSSAGTASIASTTITFVDGLATIVVSGDAKAWADEETDTLTIANLTILGHTVTGGTSVETFTAVE